MNNGGLVTQWLVDTFFMGKRASGNEAFDEMLNLAGNVDACSDGLIFLPYLFGERAPIWDEKARGVYFGIHGSHHLGHFARATIEGILFAMYSIYEIITSDHDGIFEVRATGGYLRSELMVQIQADIFGIPVGVPSNFEGSSIGSAILALKALGRIGSYDEISEFIKVEKIYKPDQKKTLIYRKQFNKFKNIYEQVKGLF
jgi:gluconokinase